MGANPIRILEYVNVYRFAVNVYGLPANRVLHGQGYPIAITITITIRIRITKRSPQQNGHARSVTLRPRISIDELRRRLNNQRQSSGVGLGAAS